MGDTYAVILGPREFHELWELIQDCPELVSNNLRQAVAKADADHVCVDEAN